MPIELRFQHHLQEFTLDLNLSLPGQGVTAIFGPSGCGKTTLLRLIAGLEHCPQGLLRMGQQRWQDGDHFVPPHRRALGYVFQEASLFEHLDVQGNINYGARRCQPQKQRLSLAQLIELLDLGDLLKRRTNQLSGGERQRVAIARALATDPQILLMDEPLSALDLPRKREILPYLEQLHQELSIPVLYVTHAPDEVARLADHLLVMENGQALACGPLSETLARLDLPIRLGEDAGVVIEARIVERDSRWHLARAEFDGGSLWVKDGGHPIGQAVRLRVLARDISLASQRHTDQSIVNLLPAQIDEIAANGHPAVVLVKLQAGPTSLLARLTARSIDMLGLEPGQSTWVQIKSVAVLE